VQEANAPLGGRLLARLPPSHRRHCGYTWSTMLFVPMNAVRFQVWCVTCATGLSTPAWAATKTWAERPTAPNGTAKWPPASSKPSSSKTPVRKKNIFIVAGTKFHAFTAERVVMRYCHSEGDPNDAFHPVGSFMKASVAATASAGCELNIWNVDEVTKRKEGRSQRGKSLLFR